MRTAMAPGLSAEWEKVYGVPWVPTLTEDGILVWDPTAKFDEPHVMAQEYVNNLFHLIMNHPRQLANAINLGLVDPNDKTSIETFNLATDLVAHYYHASATKQDLHPSFERADDYSFVDGGTAPLYNELLKKQQEENKDKCDNSGAGGGQGGQDIASPPKHPLWNKQAIEKMEGPGGEILREVVKQLQDLKAQGKISDLDAAEQDQRTGQIVRAMAKEAQEKNLDPGNWLGDLVGALEPPKPPKISPKELLKRTIRGKVKAKRGQRKQTYKKLNRAYIDLASQRVDSMIIPGYQRFRARVLLVTDTSGSRWGREMQESCDIVCAVLKTLKTPLEHISVGMDIQTKGLVSSFADVQKLMPHGGGGTDFAKFFQWFDNEGDDIDVVIFMTDGYTDGVPESYPANISQKFVWVIDEGGIKCANFGKTIFLDKEKN